MKISTRNLLIILGVLVIGFLVMQMTKQSGRSKSIRSELVNIDTAKVGQVRISSPKGEVELNKEGDGWKVIVGGVTKPTKENAVTDLIATLNTIKPSRLAAKKPEKWKDYQVDSTGTRVQVLDGENVLTDIVIGRFGVEGQRSYYSFIRLYEENDVYVAQDFMSIGVYGEAADYRDNNVLRLPADSLYTIRFEYPDNSFRMAVNNEKWYEGGREVDSTAVADFLQGLRFVSSKSFYDGAAPQGPARTVIFGFSGSQEDITIRGFETSDGLVIQSSDNEYELFMDTTLTSKLFKERGVFGPTQ